MGCAASSTEMCTFRHHNCANDVEPHRHPVCTIIALPILLMVCTTSSVSCVAHAIPNVCEVGISIKLIQRNQADGFLQIAPVAWYRVRMECLPFDKFIVVDSACRELRSACGIMVCAEFKQKSFTRWKIRLDYGIRMFMQQT